MANPHTRLLTFLYFSLIISSALARIVSRELTVPDALPGAWQYQGCYVDVDRTLQPGAYVDTEGMTSESCISYCESKGYQYAGTEWYHECYCGIELAPGGVLASEEDCNTPCVGNSSEPCGGPFRLSVFYSSEPVGPQPNTGITKWPYLGCYAEGTTGRALTYAVTTIPAGEMNGENCSAACEAEGYILAGTEYSGECYCGNEFSNGGGPAPDGSAQCNMACSGDNTEICGGPDRLDVYSFDPLYDPSATPTSTSTPSATPTVIEPVSCPESDGTTYTSLDGKTFVVECFIDHYGNDLEMAWVSSYEDCCEACATTASCAAISWIPGAPGPCYMKSSHESSVSNLAIWGASLNSVPSTTPSSTSEPVSSSSSAAASSSILPSTDSPASSTSATTVSDTTSTSSTASSSSSVATPTGLPFEWSYQGCWIDNQFGRILPYRSDDSQTLTQESCAQTCYELGYNVSGTQFSQECYCGNAVINGGEQAPDADCNMPCTGNAEETCGAGNRITIFANGPLTVYPVPQTQLEGIEGSWTYQGCLHDLIEEKRAFPWQLILTDTNSPNECLSQCAKFGYMAAGLEYHYECYCGDPADIIEYGEQWTPETECNTACTGEVTAVCGGQQRLSVYYWTGDPLTTWSYPEGAEAGEYTFLIGGVIIPLMTTQAINGKVIFVEKWGTGPPNTTGTYELDLTEIDNFDLAWRPLHVKTDPFCAAGVTLPDKAGRLLNVGGWSLGSTFGTRLFWPDGSDGVWGTNDWEEDVNELSLQDGRWYPTSMVMANGSVLIVGGEEGANGVPVPTLELLPYTGTAPLYMDWLERTDPNNLYPYLAVLPEGGIFVAYWNEARILDEVTFETTTVLPMIPGSVIDSEGGRTYPLEGTGVLLPQHYPFTDPLGVLICGGATPNFVALDNCVSMYPQAQNPTWTIERMPSKRVISCMAPLPDGTYLILNGAHQGVAGFGLAVDPNLNAVLYDPTKPEGARMSVMANTTVARMYHSEAITLLDGRVLVSGSDPQDNLNPQEYRVETFIPPYLKTGLPRPTFSIVNTDWALGETGIGLTLGQPAQNGNIQVSLLGSVTSTHGNSMGSRTMFLNVNCAPGGTACTIDAPPNEHICPPGWYQLFVLDGGIPAVGVFVRIGGDPAEFGNWPPSPEFSKPGM